MRLIDADALIEKGYWHGKRPDIGNPYGDGVDAVDTADIDNAPTIDPESLRPKGEWITMSYWKKRRGHHVQLVFKKCSLCNTRVKARWNNNFCPNCGADMRGSPNDS